MTLELLKNNYYRIYDHTNVPDIDPPLYKVGPFHSEIIKQAEYIYQNKTKDLYLFLSGGLDSEYMVHVFHSLNYKFTPVIARYHGIDDNGNHIIYNHHDNAYAYKICDKLNLKPLLIDLDFKEFIESKEMLDLAASCGCWCTARTPILKVCKIISEKYNGCIFLGNEVYFLTCDLSYDSPNWKYDRSKAGPIWYHIAYTKLFSMMNFFKINNIEGSPAFFGYSAETFLSFLLDPDIIKLTNNEYPGRVMFHQNKGKIFNQHSNFNLEEYKYYNTNPETDPRVKRMKFGGFEIFSNTKLNHHPTILKVNEIYNEKSKDMWYIDYKSLIEKLSINQI